MRDNFFLDTNVLLYLFDIDGQKKEIAKQLLNSQHNISVQGGNLLPMDGNRTFSVVKNKESKTPRFDKIKTHF